MISAAPAPIPSPNPSPVLGLNTGIGMEYRPDNYHGTHISKADQLVDSTSTTGKHQQTIRSAQNMNTQDQKSGSQIKAEDPGAMGGVGVMRETNAERIAKGLGPLPPTRRSSGVYPFDIGCSWLAAGHCSGERGRGRS